MSAMDGRVVHHDWVRLISESEGLVDMVIWTGLVMGLVASFQKQSCVWEDHIPLSSGLKSHPLSLSDS